MNTLKTNMNRFVQQLAGKSYHWLTQAGPGDNGTCWVVVGDRETGIDVTYHLVRQYVRDMKGAAPSSVEIPHDTLPTCPAYNPKNGRAVFVLSQPNHIPTVQTSMQGGLADLRKEDVSEKEASAISQMLKAGAPDPEDSSDGSSEPNGPSLAAGVENKYLIDAQDQTPTGRIPDLILLDQKEPMWAKLSDFIRTANSQGRGAEVLMTDRVEIDRPPSDLGHGGDYGPAE